MLRLLAKKLLAPVIYRHPPLVLSPHGLYFHFDAILATKGLTGAVLEIGCAAGGTAALAWKLLQTIGDSREYVCVDTFSGFVPEQYSIDVALGNTNERRAMFSSSDVDLVRKVLRQHHAQGVRLIQGDVAALDPEELPKAVSVCLIDVDLYIPVLAALRKVWPRLELGGRIIVDDCDEGSAYQARQGYAEFIAENGLKPDIRIGMGFAEK